MLCTSIAKTTRQVTDHSGNVFSYTMLVMNPAWMIKPTQLDQSTKNNATDKSDLAYLNWEFNVRRFYDSLTPYHQSCFIKELSESVENARIFAIDNYSYMLNIVIKQTDGKETCVRHIVNDINRVNRCCLTMERLITLSEHLNDSLLITNPNAWWRTLYELLTNKITDGTTIATNEWMLSYLPKWLIRCLNNVN